MKKYLYLLVLSLISYGEVYGDEKTTEDKGINMLFLGNSFTARHDIASLVKEVFEEGQPGLTLNVEKVIYGGQDMFRHHDLYFSETMVRLNSITAEEVEQKKSAIESLLASGKPPEFYIDYWKEIGRKPSSWKVIKSRLGAALKRQHLVADRIKDGRRVKWDYLVLQSYADVVPDLEAGYAKYVQKWAKMAEAEGIKVILYVTAPHAQNGKPVEAPQALEQTNMEMKLIQQLVERIKPHAVVPVGLGIKNIQEGGTSMKFRYSRDAHPNQYSAFLASNMFYAAFFKKSTEGFKFDTVTETKIKGGNKDPDGGNIKVVIDEATKKMLQKTAYDSVMEFDGGYGK